MAVPISLIFAIIRPPMPSKKFHRPLNASRHSLTAPSQSPLKAAMTPLKILDQNFQIASMYSSTGPMKEPFALSLSSSHDAEIRAFT
ncbi:hypothetical protein G6F50_018188 [Rhizopus delemar]|uniref:Uncharacterized protein n=1 Tax=Rhizopus delemar TaxID=936053 RepID=A0A9P6XN68_9FUNG|nr:hypothetical protein G6F50_018188 [Rhizopus delemar]